MEITVKHNGTEITVKETHLDKYRHASLTYEKDAKKIESVITVMAKEVINLVSSEIKE